MIRVLLVDDSPNYARVVAYTLDQQPDMKVVGIAGTLAEARAMLKGVDVAILETSSHALSLDRFVVTMRGEKHGREGVKLEEELLVTETGSEPISRFPFEDELLEAQV